MFLGRYTHTIDAKGRLSIPAGLRMELIRQSDRTPVLTNARSHLALYPREVWEARAERLSSVSFTQPEIEAYQRFFASGAADCPVDGQGRILIPAHLREHAKLDREVVIAGVVDRIEIWDRETFDAALAKVPKDLSDVSPDVVKLLQGGSQMGGTGGATASG